MFAVTAGEALGAPAGAPAVAPVSLPGDDLGTATALFQSTILPAVMVPNDWNGSVENCDAGETSAAYTEATITAVNYMRAQVGVPPVVLRQDTVRFAQEAAFMMLANAKLSHYPGTDWKCYTTAGASAAAVSNIAMGQAGATAVRGYMADLGDNNTAVGHRRWILDRSVTAMGSGSTGFSNALVVAAGPWGVPGEGFIPWPAAGFFPGDLEPGGRWSLTYYGADFSAAKVSLSVGGKPVAVTQLPLERGAAGATLVWEWDAKSEVGQYPALGTVEVLVSGIKMPSGATQDYAYTVKLVSMLPEITGLAARWEGKTAVISWDNFKAANISAVVFQSGTNNGYLCRPTPTGCKVKITKVKPGKPWKATVKATAGDGFDIFYGLPVTATLPPRAK